MHIGSSFTREEVEQTLLSAGLTPGTNEWHEARCRNYIPIEDGLYAEADDFDLVPRNKKLSL